MDIQGMGGPGRVDGVQRVNKIAKALAIPEVRQERIQEIQAQIKAGGYETDARLGAALERFMVENPDLLDE